MNNNGNHRQLTPPKVVGLLVQGLSYLGFCLSLYAPSSVAETKTYLVDLVMVTPTSNRWLKEEVFPTGLPEQWYWFDQAFHITTGNLLPVEQIDDPINTVNNPLVNAVPLSTHPGRVQQRLLEQAQTRLTRSGGYRVLYQSSFVQEFKDLNQATRYWVQSDSQVRGQPELAGWLTFYRGRFLHVRSDMLLTQLDWEARAEAKSKASELSPLTNNDSLDEQVQTSSLHQEASQPSYWVKRIPVEHRQKLKSDNVYYLDHPGLGILIKLSPLGT